MLPVLHLDPAVKAASTIAAVAMFRHQPLQPHQAGMPKQIRPDLALFERCKVDAIDTALQDFDTENSKISALWTSC
jgi:hypothetical protein